MTFAVVWVAAGVVTAVAWMATMDRDERREPATLGWCALVVAWWPLAWLAALVMFTGPVAVRRRVAATLSASALLVTASGAGSSPSFVPEHRTRHVASPPGRAGAGPVPACGVTCPTWDEMAHSYLGLGRGSAPTSGVGAGKTSLPDHPELGPAQSVDPSMQQVMDAVGHCESNNDYQAENPVSSASGKYQFVSSTWRWVTGLEPPASAHPPTVQDHAFLTLWADGAGARHWNPSRGCWGPMLGGGQ